MPRGGARGGGGAGGGMRSQPLPFDLDPELVEAVENGFEDDADSGKEIFPEFGEMIMQAPATANEREQVRIARLMDSKRRAGPFWSGNWDQWVQHDSTMRGKSGGKFDPFEGALTHREKQAQKMWRPANLSRIKLEKRFFPKELWDIIGADDEDDDEIDGRPVKRQKRLGLAKTSIVDKLARFDEGNEEETNADAEANEEDRNEDEDDDSDAEHEPQDDDFEEDEDDNDDYNAEQYFDGGEEDFEEEGGDYGEDGY